MPVFGLTNKLRLFFTLQCSLGNYKLTSTMNVFSNKYSRPGRYIALIRQVGGLKVIKYLDKPGVDLIPGKTPLITVLQYIRL